MKNKSKSIIIVYLVLNVFYGVFESMFYYLIRFYGEQMYNLFNYFGYAYEDILSFLNIIFPLKGLLTTIFGADLTVSTNFFNSFSTLTNNANYLNSIFPNKTINEIEIYAEKVFEMHTINTILLESLSITLLILIGISAINFFRNYYKEGSFIINQNMQLFLKRFFIISIDVMMAKRKISLTELSKRVGITLANLSILKTGKARAIRFETLNAICEALDCQPGDILEYRKD